MCCCVCLGLWHPDWHRLITKQKYHVNNRIISDPVDPLPGSLQIHRLV